MEQTLKKVGGSVLATIPSAFLKSLHLHSGSKIEMQLEGDVITIRPAAKLFPYTEAELFADVSPQDHRDLVADTLLENEQGVSDAIEKD